MEGNLLIVEDQESLRLSLRDYFEREGFSVATAADGRQALAELAAFRPDLVILDVQLPHLDGLELCQHIRREQDDTLAIIMVSGIKKELIDRVVGLEMGADVYLTKPFETRELLAQTRALLRRQQALANQKSVDGGWFVVDHWLRIHFEKRLVETGGRDVHLTSLEFDVLKFLAGQPGLPVTRADLFDAVWGYESRVEVSDAAVNTCISKLRAKIEPDPSKPCYIQSVHGVGYRFRPL
jgi:DNA-binding response OmpR family regulator